MEGHEEIPANNGAAMNVSQIINAVMSSAAEAELGAILINLQTRGPGEEDARRTRTPAAEDTNANR